MRRALFVTLLALVACPAAAADITVGVADDRGKYAEDGGASFFATLRYAEMVENRIVIYWDPGRPTTIPEKAFLDRSMGQASVQGVRIVFAVYAAHANAITANPAATEWFGGFVQQLARTYPQVKHFVIGNEPNLSRFWQPQFNPDGTNASAAPFVALLARSYDALKAVDPSIRVIGAGLSERGNDNPAAASNVSTSPVRFIRALGDAYRASGRTAPLMDVLDFHPYPESNDDSLTTEYAWPSVGYANIDRLKQAIWDAFNGTAQRTVEEGLKLRIGEIGWQVATSGPGYTGTENVPVTTADRQARLYGEFLHHVACDPAVGSVNFFGLVDEAQLERWQAGLVRVDGSRRPSFDAVRTALAETAGRCAGAPRTWRHATHVVGVGVEFGNLARPRWWKQTSWGFRVTAAEEATYRAGVFRLPDASKKRSAAVAAIPRFLAAATPAQAVLSAAGTVTAHWRPQVKFPAKRLAPGSYVYAVSLAAAMNPARSSVFVSSPFRVK